MTASPAQPFPAAAADVAAARERVVRVLTDRYADDSLTTEEFEARLDAMYALDSPAALDAMARALDRPALPTAAVPAALPAVGAPPPAPLPAPYSAAYPAAPAAYPGDLADPAITPPPARYGSPDDAGRLLAFMSTIKRRGRWVVPPRLRAVAVLGELVLDLREAAIPPACHIELLAVLGNVKVLLPPGVDAYVEIDAVAGSANDRTGGAAAAPGAPRVRVTGTAFLGEVVVAER